jgi:hypothetical protein
MVGEGILWWAYYGYSILLSHGSFKVPPSRGVGLHEATAKLVRLEVLALHMAWHGIGRSWLLLMYQMLSQLVRFHCDAAELRRACPHFRPKQYLLFSIEDDVMIRMMI